MKNHEEDEEEEQGQGHQDYHHQHHHQQYQEDRDVIENHITITESPPSGFTLSPESSRSYRTPSPAGDFGAYSDFSWADDPEPRVHPNRTFPAEPLVVLANSVHTDSPQNDAVESHSGGDEDLHHSGDSESDEIGKGKPGLGSFNRRKLKPNLKTNLKTTTATTMKSKSSSHGVAKRALLGFRICGFAFCLISFSVMAANRDQGWALESFFRYKEFRYCLGVNVLGFVYSGFQVLDLIHYVTTHTHLVPHHFRFYTDFFIDQVISYLLMSASSSASTRVDDWESNWGKDKFPDMARTSIGFSFAAFGSLALSSIISGYILCTSKVL